MVGLKDEIDGVDCERLLFGGRKRRKGALRALLVEVIEKIQALPGVHPGCLRK